MKIVLNSESLEFPKQPKEPNHSIIQLVEKNKMILKNFNSDNFNLTVHFFGDNKLWESYSEVKGYKEIPIKKEYKSFKINLIHNGLKRDEDAIFEIFFE
jgi:hypothetical protein